MDRYLYLTEFKFTKRTITEHLLAFCKETQTDYIHDLQGFYADIFGCGDYYRLETVSVKNENFEVYADTTSVKKSYLDRIYPLKPKAITTPEPIRKIRVFFSDGVIISTEIRLCSQKAKAFYLGNKMKTDAGIEYATKVEIVA